MAEVSNGLQLIKVSPCGIRDTKTGGVPDHFKRVFPDAVYKSALYYKVRKLWKLYTTKKALAARQVYFNQLVALGPEA